MSTAAIIIQALLTYGPDVAKAIQAIFANNNPTQADWDNLFNLAEKPHQWTFVTAPVVPPPAQVVVPLP
jgi:hypothetical protein